MTRLLRILFPRTCRRIFSEGWETGRCYQIKITQRRHPRDAEGRFSERIRQ